MDIKTLRALALLACGAVGANAFAETAPSTLSLDMNFRYELIDLAPDDGVTPSISFYDRAAEIYLVQWSRGAPANEIRKLLDEHGTATTEVEENFSTVTGTATGASIDFNLLHRSAYASAKNWFAFTLSPNTRAVFTADYDTTLWIDPSAAQSASSVQFYGSINNALPGASELQALTIHHGTGSSAGSVSVMADTAAWSANGELSLYATGQVWTMPAPIPEPRQAGMLLAGAMLLGAGSLSGLLPSSSRRRSRPAAAH